MDDSASPDKRLIMYTSDFCGHSMAVERYLRQNQVAVELRSIDGDPDARAAVMALNRGYASVPTLLFPDGTQLTEPSLRQLKQKLSGEAAPGILDRLRRRWQSE